MKYYIEIKADTNDADYVTERSEISKKDLEKLMPLFEAIKKNRGDYNWFTSEYGSSVPPEEMYSDLSELVSEFEDYVPYGEHGIHTIESITLLEISKETELI